MQGCNLRLPPSRSLFVLPCAHFLPSRGLTTLCCRPRIKRAALSKAALSRRRPINAGRRPPSRRCSIPPRLCARQSREEWDAAVVSHSWPNTSEKPFHFLIKARCFSLPRHSRRTLKGFTVYLSANTETKMLPRPPRYPPAQSPSPHRSAGKCRNFLKLQSIT